METDTTPTERLPLTAVERQVAVLTASGYSAVEVGVRLGITARTVERYRSKPEVKVLIAARNGTGLQPADVLEGLLYAKNETVRLRAAVELGKLIGADAPAATQVDPATVDGAVVVLVHPAGMADAALG